MRPGYPASTQAFSHARRNVLMRRPCRWKTWRQIVPAFSRALCSTHKASVSVWERVGEGKHPARLFLRRAGVQTDFPLLPIDRPPLQRSTSDYTRQPVI
jgi:hypothetical protein